MIDHLRHIIAEHERLHPDEQLEEINNLNWDPLQDFTYANLLKYANENLMPSSCNPFASCCNEDPKKGENKPKPYHRKSTYYTKKINFKQDILKLKQSNKDRRNSCPIKDLVTKQ
eukprot:Mrub_14380.p2 GENE.Mrub_14380~~Mrub_14380.p2  ORF type:complete len:115 (-),score=12.11 Mrub_14380:103-447(-)